MKHACLTILLVLGQAGAALASGENYCAQLQAANLRGKHVIIRSVSGGKSDAIDGVILEFQQETLIIKLGPAASEELTPLYEKGKIVEPKRSRAYVNCGNIFSVIESP